MPRNSQKETINTLLDFFKNIPLSRLIEIKCEEQENLKNDVWQKEQLSHLVDDHEIDKTKKSHERLYVIRREKRIKQKDVARILRISNSTYSQKEQGKADFTLTEAKLLANYFNVTLDDLFGD